MNQTEFLTPHEFVLFREGDRKIFRKIYDQYYGLAVYVAERCGVGCDDRMDVVQESFSRLYFNRGKVKTQASLKSWLMKTTRNLAIDKLRKIKKENRLFQENIEPQASENTDDAVRHELEIALVGDLIDEVTTETNDDTFALFYRDGRLAKEIAAMKDESVGTVTSRISRYRSRFRQKLLNKIYELEQHEFSSTAGAR